MTAISWFPILLIFSMLAWGRIVYFILNCGWKKVGKCGDCGYMSEYSFRLDPCTRCGNSSKITHHVARINIWGGWQVKDETNKK